MCICVQRVQPFGYSYARIISITAIKHGVVLVFAGKSLSLHRFIVAAYEPDTDIRQTSAL